MSILRGLIVVMILGSLLGCGRYDYYPRGIHAQIQKIPGVNKNAKVHIVKKGETIALIARTYGMNYKDIARRNGIKSPYTIYVGQRLMIHGGSQSSTAKNPNKGKRSPAVSAPSPGKFRLIWPVKGRLSSKFGPRKNRMHDGIDIAAKKGTHIVAVAAGEVVYADNKLTGYGNLIIIRHSDNMFTAYAHNNRNFVSYGDKVKQGQHIANVGETGRATGPHVHFELRKGETAIDPIPYLPRR